MTEEDKIQKVGEEIIYQGRSIRGRELPGPGEVDFVQQFRRTDGKDIVVHQKISVPAELFAPEDIELRFTTTIPTVEQNTSVPVKFEVKKGALYPGDQIQIQFSKIGNREEDFENLHILAYDRNDFTFRVPMSVESDTCFLRLVALDSQGKILDSTLSNQFTIQKPTPKIFTIDPIKPVLQQGERVDVSFTFSHPQKPVRFKTFLANLSTHEDIDLIPVSADARRFSFTVPEDLEGEKFNLQIVALDDSRTMYSSKASSPFQIKKKEPLVISIDLFSPVKGAKLQAGSRVELKWILEHPDRSFSTKLEASYVAAGNETPIEMKENANNRGVITWTVPSTLKDPTNVDIILSLPEVAVRKTFGPFLIIGGREAPEVEGDHELTEKIELVDNLLGQIRLPVKRGLFGGVNSRSIGTFLYHIVTTNEIGKYFTAHNQLLAIKEEMNKDPLHTQLSGRKDYDDFVNIMKILQDARSQLKGIEDQSAIRQELKAYLRSYLTTPTMKEQLKKDFIRVFSAEPKRFDANKILSDVKYLSWFMEHASEVDAVLDEQGSAHLRLVAVYEGLSFALVQAEVMFNQLVAARKILKNLNKNITSQ